MTTVLQALSTGEVDVPVGPLVVGTASDSATGTVTVLGLHVSVAQPGTAIYQGLRSNVDAAIASSNFIGAITGLVEVSHPSGTMNNATGATAGVSHTGAGILSTAQGMVASVTLNGSRVITEAHCFSVDGPDILGGTGSITNVHQIHTDDCDFGTNRYNAFLGGCVGANSPTNCYGLWIDPVSGGSSANYAIYTNAGQISFGDTVTVAGDILTTGASQRIRIPTLGSGLGPPASLVTGDMWIDNVSDGLADGLYHLFVKLPGAIAQII
jgi:hypothetical protein